MYIHYKHAYNALDLLLVVGDVAIRSDQYPWQFSAMGNNLPPGVPRSNLDDDQR